MATAKLIRAAMEDMKPRFPEGIDYKVTYDTTVFVTETIGEVIHTLFEAFILVVLVVYLFLGNVRATLIPMIAVPVSLIGTFAILLAFGYSANTISMFAMILAIGIVVDDAIVVVEAVEHITGNHGSARRRSREGGDAGDHGSDHRDHARAAVGLRAGGIHSRHHRSAVPAIRRDGVGRDAAVGHQRADAEPRAVCPDAAAWTFQQGDHATGIAGHRQGARCLRQCGCPSGQQSRAQSRVHRPRRRRDLPAL